MNGCTLRAPNSQLFSDNVIGSVVQRAWMSDDFVNDDEDVVPSQPSKVCSNQRTTTRISAMERKRMRDEPARNKTAVLDDYEQEFAGNTAPAAGEERQRELRRMRQIRYRKKKFDLTMKLKENTAQLRSEVEELEKKRRTLSVTVPTNQTMWDVALKYFQIFRFGIQEPPLVLGSEPLASNSPQLDFLLTNMTENVLFNSSSGAGSIIQAWKFQTLWFKDFAVGLEGLVKASADVLVATTTTSFIITERTLEKVFPQLSDQRGNRSLLEARVAYALLGQRISVRGTARFAWDPALGRVASLTTQSDLLTPMLRLLGTLEDVSVMFEKASISPDFQWSSTITM